MVGGNLEARPYSLGHFLIRDLFRSRLPDFQSLTQRFSSFRKLAVDRAVPENQENLLAGLDKIR